MPPLPQINPFGSKGAQLGADGAQSLLLHNRMLGERLYIYSLARFLVVGAIVFGTLFAEYVVGIEGLDMHSLFLLATLLFLYNLLVFLLVHRCSHAEGCPLPGRLLLVLMHATIVLDFIFLTVALWLVGGTKSPFRAFYILNVIIAGVLLSRLAAYAHAAVAYLLFTGLVVGEWSGLIATRWPVGAISGVEPLDGRYVLTVLAVQGMLMAVSVFFLTGMTRLLRAGERRLRHVNDELERLSQMQHDFLRIALHDLKSPVSAVVSLLYSVQSGLGGTLSEQNAHWVERSQLRLKELSTFLRDLQTLALLGSGRISEFVKKTELRGLLAHVVEGNQDLAEMHKHTLTLDVLEDLPEVYAIPALLEEAVANFVTNAIKYTPDEGTIIVRAKRVGDNVHIEVEDNGIGIAPEDRNRLFREFVRIRRTGTAVGEVSGTGLGLAIVQRIVHMHGGSVSVRGELDQGSTFTIALPVEPTGDMLPALFPPTDEDAPPS